MAFNRQLKKLTSFSLKILQRLFPPPMQDFKLENTSKQKDAYKVALQSPVSTNFAKWFLLNAHAEGGENWRALKSLLDQRNPTLLRDIVFETNGIGAHHLPAEYQEEQSLAFLTLRDIALEKLAGDLISCVPGGAGSLQSVLEMLSPCQLVLQNEKGLTTLFEGVKHLQDLSAGIQSGKVH